MELAKPGGDQRHASVMAAATDVRGVADVMDVVTMCVLLIHRMFHRQADRLYNGRGRVCSRFCWLIIAGYQLSWRNAMRRVGFIHRDVEACLFEFFFDIKLAAGLELA